MQRRSCSSLIRRRERGSITDSPCDLSKASNKALALSSRGTPKLSPQSFWIPRHHLTFCVCRFARHTQFPLSLGRRLDPEKSEQSQSPSSPFNPLPLFSNPKEPKERHTSAAPQPKSDLKGPNISILPYPIVRGLPLVPALPPQVLLAGRYCCRKSLVGKLP